jgi:hypothetical protein
MIRNHDNGARPGRYPMSHGPRLITCGGFGGEQDFAADLALADPATRGTPSRANTGSA